METNKVNLKRNSDKQQMLLMQLSYLDFDIEEYEKMRGLGKKITINDLEDLLSNPDNSYLSINHIIERVKLKIPTQREIIEQLKENSLGNLAIVDIAKKTENSFKAIAFEDDMGNRGISYSGMDFAKISQDIDDNLPLYVKESPELIESAKIFFDKNKGIDNYLYGHAVGGNMAMHTYIENYNSVKRIFTVNSTAIEKEPNTIDSPKVQMALGNSEKNHCYRTGGAYVGEYKGEVDPYEYNTQYVLSQKSYDSLLENLIPDGILFKEISEYIDNEIGIYVDVNVNDIIDNFVCVFKYQANGQCKNIPDRIRENQQPNKPLKVDSKIRKIINEFKKFSKDIIERTKLFIKDISGNKEDGRPDENNFENDSSNKFKEKYKVDDIVVKKEDESIDEQARKMSLRNDIEKEDE